MALEDYKTLVFFKDNKSFVIDVKKLCGENRLFGNILRNEELFRNVRVSPGGNGIEWGAAETAKILNCSRQYIKQLADKERLSAVREGANSNIYMKSTLESEEY